VSGVGEVMMIGERAEGEMGTQKRKRELSQQLQSNRRFSNLCEFEIVAGFQSADEW